MTNNRDKASNTKITRGLSNPGAWKSLRIESTGQFKCGWRSWLDYTKNIPWDWHCVSCNWPESASLATVSAGADVSSQRQREGRYLQTNHNPVSQTSISWSQLHFLYFSHSSWGEKHWAGANSKLQGYTHTHTPETNRERPWPAHSPPKPQCQSFGSK